MARIDGACRGAPVKNLKLLSVMLTILGEMRAGHSSFEADAPVQRRAAKSRHSPTTALRRAHSACHSRKVASDSAARRHLDQNLK